MEKEMKERGRMGEEKEDRKKDSKEWEDKEKI
jgi:hypothetical protein